MKIRNLLGTTAAISLLMIGTAAAVDITETSIGDGPMDTTNLIVTEGGQSRQLTLITGETLYGVCQDNCTIQIVGGKKVEAKGNDLVSTNGSSLSVYNYKSTGVDITETSTGDGPMQNVDMIVTENGQSRQLTLITGETLYGACQDDCTVQIVGGKTIQAKGNQVVSTNGSSLSASSYVAQAPQLQQQVAFLPSTDYDSEDGTEGDDN